MVAHNLLWLNKTAGTLATLDLKCCSWAERRELMGGAGERGCEGA